MKPMQIAAIVLFIATAGFGVYTVKLQGEVSEQNTRLDEHMADVNKFKDLAATATYATQQEQYRHDFEKSTRYVEYAAKRVESATDDRNMCAGAALIVALLGVGAWRMANKKEQA